MKKTKRIVALALALVLIMSITAMAVSAATYACPSCGTTSTAPQGGEYTGSVIQAYTEPCIHGHQGRDTVQVRMLKQNYICRECNHFWAQQLGTVTTRICNGT